MEAARRYNGVSFEINLTGIVEWTKGCWVARNAEFGITTYGLDRDLTRGRLAKAVEIVLGRLVLRDSDALRERFNKAGIEYIECAALSNHISGTIVFQRETDSPWYDSFQTIGYYVHV